MLLSCFLPTALRQGVLLLSAIAATGAHSIWIEVAGKDRHLGKGYAKTWHVATLAWERP